MLNQRVVPAVSMEWITTAAQVKDLASDKRWVFSCKSDNLGRPSKQKHTYFFGMQGLAIKTFVDIVVQICMLILWHDLTLQC